MHVRFLIHSFGGWVLLCIVTGLVDRIFAVRAADPTADIAALESEIDRHVYALYHLTPDEIEIVEGTTP